MKVSFLIWDAWSATNLWSLGYNWGWGYYRALRDMGLADYGGLIKGYDHRKDDVAIITDPIHIATKERTSPDFFKRVKDDGKKLVFIIYESIFDNDQPVEAGGSSRNHMYLLKDNPTWLSMMGHADLLVVADPRDAYMVKEDQHHRWPKTIYLPLAVDEKVFVPQPSRIPKACFIGSRWISGRAELLNRAGSMVEYPKTPYGGHSFAEKMASTKAYAEVCGKYGVNLNVRTVFAGLQLRIIETMALGRVCVSHKPTNLPGREDIWKQLKAVKWYDSPQDMVVTLRNMLGNEKAMLEIGDRARAEFLANHTHTHRIKSILTAL